MCYFTWQGLVLVKNKQNESIRANRMTREPCTWVVTHKNGDEGGIPSQTTPTDQLKQKNKPSGKMQRNGLSICHIRATQHQTKGGRKRRAFCGKKLCFLDKNTTERPIDTRVQKTDTCWARAAFTLWGCWSKRRSSQQKHADRARENNHWILSV